MSVNGSDKNTREGVTTSARGTTVTRTLFVSETTSTGGEGTTTSASSAVAGDVRITGGAVVEDTYVDAVTTETVERVDDGVPEVDLGVHDLAEVDVEALDESKGDSDKDSSDDIADVDAPGEHSEAGADTQTTDATQPTRPPIPTHPARPSTSRAVRRSLGETLRRSSRMSVLRSRRGCRMLRRCRPNRRRSPRRLCRMRPLLLSRRV